MPAHSPRVATPTSSSVSLSDAGGDRRGKSLVTLRVHLRDVGTGVAEQHLCGFQPVLLADAGGEGMTELVRVPAVSLPPRPQFFVLLLGQPQPPRGVRLVVLLRQVARGRERGRRRGPRPTRTSACCTSPRDSASGASPAWRCSSSCATGNGASSSPPPLPPGSPRRHIRARTSSRSASG